MEAEWMVILEKILEMKEKNICRKFVGALTVELVRKKLIDSRFDVSNRDVYIEGVPKELDLLIVKEGKRPEENLLYNPNDVLAVLEIKFRGSYGSNAVKYVKETFDSVKRVNEKIECFYITLSENKKYKHRVTKEKLGYDCFELLTRERSLESSLSRGEIEPSGDWKKFLTRLYALRA